MVVVTTPLKEMMEAVLVPTTHPPPTIAHQETIAATLLKALTMKDLKTLEITQASQRQTQKTRRAPTIQVKKTPVKRTPVKRTPVKKTQVKKTLVKTNVPTSAGDAENFVFFSATMLGVQ